MESVKFTVLKNNQKGIAIGEENKFLAVDYTESKQWRFRLYDLHDWTPLTGSFTLSTVEDLRDSRKAKSLRDIFEKYYGDEASSVLEQAVGVLQDSESVWLEDEAEVEEKKVPSEQEQELQRKAEEEAESILSSPDIFEALKPHLDNVVAGEDENKQLEFLLLTGGKTIPQMILNKGESGAGKSQLSKLADVFKTKTVGRFSAHGLDYTNLEDYEVLRLKELGAMDEEFQGVSTLKFLSADDQGYTVEVAVKEEGTFTTVQYRIPPLTVLTTTTRIEVDPQFERRAWILNLDESKEQTERVRLWKARHEREKAEVALGLRQETSYAYSLRVLKAVVERIEPVDVVIPFPEALTEILGAEQLRLRGDYDKFYGLVKSYGRLYRRKLESIEGVNGHRAFLLLPEHAFNALKIAEKPYATMTSSLEERSRKLIAKMKELNITHAGDTIDMDERGKIAVALGKSETTVKFCFNDWERAGYVTRTEGKGRGRPQIFKLLYDLSVIEKKASVSFSIDKLYEEKGAKLAEELESFLKRLQKLLPQGKNKFIFTLEKNLRRQTTPVASLSDETQQLSSKDYSTKEETAVNDGTIEAYFEQSQPEKKLTLGELEEELRRTWQKGTTEGFIDLIHQKGTLNKVEANEFVVKLIDEGKVAYDPDGWLVWTK